MSKGCSGIRKKKKGIFDTEFEFLLTKLYCNVLSFNHTFSDDRITLKVKMRPTGINRRTSSF